MVKWQWGTYSHEVLAVSLGVVTKRFKAEPFLENWPFNAVVKVPGFGNLPVFFAFANSSGLGESTLKKMKNEKKIRVLGKKI